MNLKGFLVYVSIIAQVLFPRKVNSREVGLLCFACFALVPPSGRDPCYYTETMLTCHHGEQCASARIIGTYTDSGSNIEHQQAISLLSCARNIFGPDVETENEHDYIGRTLSKNMPFNYTFQRFERRNVCNTHGCNSASGLMLSSFLFIVASLLLVLLNYCAC